MLADTVTTPAGSFPSDITAVGTDLVFFAARDPVHGRELWVRRGLGAPEMVKDLAAGPRSSYLSALVDVEGVLFFVAGHPAESGQALWKSDGTTSGTVLVKALQPNPAGGGTFSLTVLQRTVFFVAYEPETGTELWNSDGTAAGTGVVRDVNPGPGDSSPRDLTAVNGTLFFRAFTPATGHELWKSDGTPGGTVLVRDVNPGTGSFDADSFTDVSGILFFRGNEPSTGYELWRSDGTPAGTGIVRELTPGPGSSAISDLTNVNGTLFFGGYQPWNSLALWKSDGTAAGTVLVQLITPLADTLTNVNGCLFFSASTWPTGAELWTSDGTTAGTVRVATLNSGMSPRELTAVGARLFFLGYQSATNWGLWVSDGSAAGTTLLKDLAPGSAGSEIASLTDVRGTLYFRGTDPTTGPELWSSDGTSAGTVQVTDIHQGTASSSLNGGFAEHAGRVYFSPNSSTYGHELFVTDGTLEGTALLVDIEPGLNPSNPAEFVSMGGRLFFLAYSSAIGTHLWSTDGTSVGTVPVKSGSFRRLTVSGDRLYLSAVGNESQLWVSDGTTTGTMLLRTFGTLSIDQLTDVVGRLFFRVGYSFREPGSGVTQEFWQLWTSDGTVAGTTEVGAPVAGFPSRVDELEAVGRRLFFRGYERATGSELWVTDGSAAGPFLVRDLWAGSDSSAPQRLFAVGDRLYFIARDAASGSFALFTSDGTAAGTLGPLADVQYVASPMPFAGRVFFIASHGSENAVLWVSDGTGDGTHIVENTESPGGGYRVAVHQLAVVGQRLFFAVEGPLALELWAIDATDDRPVRVDGLVPDGALAIEHLTSGLGRLFFMANDGFHGLEPWATLLLTPPTSTDDAYTTAYVTSLTASAPGVLANDIPGGGTTTALLVSGPASGRLVLALDGSFTYTPATLFSGVDTFTYRATSSLGGVGSVTTVRITVAPPTFPLPPSALRVMAVVGNSVTFVWTPPPIGPAATGYQLEGGLTPGTVAGVLPVGVAPTATLTLPTGSFFVRLRTLAGGVLSDPSNEVPVHINVLVAPSAPTNLLVLVVGDTVSLAWTNTFTGGAPAGLLLDVTGAITGTVPIAATDTLSVAGVPPGAYTVRLSAANGAGAGAWSNVVTVTVPSACSGAPQAVTNFDAYVSRGVVYLRWGLPAAGPAPTGYSLNVTGAIVGALPVAGRTFSSPAPAGTYHLTLAATNPCGTSAPTTVRTVRVP